jgi:hypothetical protein
MPKFEGLVTLCHFFILFYPFLQFLLRSLRPSLKISYFFYFFGGLECVGHSFAFVDHYVLLKGVWNRGFQTSFIDETGRWLKVTMGYLCSSLWNNSTFPKCPNKYFKFVYCHSESSWLNIRWTCMWRGGGGESAPNPPPPPTHPSHLYSQ